MAIALQSILGKRSSVYESEWFPDECRRIERSFKKLDSQILEWDDERQHAAIQSGDQEDFERESDMVISKTFEVMEMKGLPPMQHPDRNQLIFMVRPCYKKLFDLIMKDVQSKINANITVTGNPGIGKSRFYLYFIWRITKEGLPYRITKEGPQKLSHLVINCGKRYHVHENKEFVELVSEQERNRFLDSADVFRLVDGWSDALEGWQGTTVLFASAGTPGMHQYMKASNAPIFVMPPWGLEELLICNEACELGLKAEDIRKEFSFFGGIPRFIFSKEIEERRSQVEGAISSEDCKGILNYVKANREVREKEYSHYVLKMVP